MGFNYDSKIVWSKKVFKSVCTLFSPPQKRKSSRRCSVKKSNQQEMRHHIAQGQWVGNDAAEMRKLWRHQKGNEQKAQAAGYVQQQH